MLIKMLDSLLRMKFSQTHPTPHDSVIHAPHAVGHRLCQGDDALKRALPQPVSPVQFPSSELTPILYLRTNIVLVLLTTTITASLR